MRPWAPGPALCAELATVVRDGASGGNTLLLVRHGRTTWNAERRFQGHKDAPLDAIGRAQARRVARELRGRGIDLLLSSDLSRAADTAAAIAAASGIPVTHDKRLRETYAGSFEGRTWHEIMESPDGEMAQRWSEGHHVRPGGDGELADEVAARAIEALNEHLAPLPQGSVVVAVSHGGTCRATLGSLLGLSVEQWWRLAVLGNCHWAELGQWTDGRWRLAGWNVGAIPEPVTGDML